MKSLKLTDNKKKILIFHPALLPYRIDFFNSFMYLFSAKVVFLNKMPIDGRYDIKNLNNSLLIDSSIFTNGFKFLGRDIRFGVFSEINKYEPDVIIASEFSFTTMACIFSKLISGRKIKIIVMTDDNLNTLRKESIFRSIVRILLIRNIDGLIVCNNETKKYYLNYNKNILYFPIVMNENKFRDTLGSSRSGLIFIEKYNLGKKKIILFVGRFVTEKRIDLIIKYIPKVISLHPDVIFVFVGDGLLQESIKKNCLDKNIQDYVLFPGWFEGEELIAWYKISSLFIILSDYEQFGAVVTEALVSGVPVICSKFAGVKEIINLKDSGFVVNPYDSDEVVNAINNLLFKSFFFADDLVNITRENLNTLDFSGLEKCLHRFVDEV